MSIHELMIVLDYASIAVMAVLTVIICFHVESYMQKFASYAAIMLTICSIGFLFKAEATDLEMLITGQRLVYSMVPHATFCMLLFIIAYCKIKLPEWLTYVGSSLDLVISVLAMTIPYVPWFYKSYWAVDAGGYLDLEKEYGFGHTFTMAVLLLYMVATVSVIIYYNVRSNRKNRRNAWKLLIAVLIPYSSYILPKLLHMENELQPVTFAIFLVIIFIMIYRENLYDVDNLLTRYALASVEDGLVVFNGEDLFEGCNQLAQSLFPPLAQAGIETDIREEVPVFKGILDGSVSNYQNGDQIYDITMTSITDGGKVVGKTVWLKNVTLQRNYTDLLEKQNANLETEVTDLYDKSHKDQLTGLYNRRSYEELKDEICRSKKDGDAFVGCFDVNNLKETNDTLGHSAGDELLCGCADILETVFGEEGKVFRVGGDEFSVIVADPKHPKEYYEEKLKEEMNLRRGQLVERFSMACGFANGPDYPVKDIQGLVQLADQAMYEDKKQYHSRDRK